MVDEIWAHISTPATNQNDALYRSLATQYSEFEPLRKEDDETPLAATNVGVSLSSTSKDSYGSFPSHLSSSLGCDARPQQGALDAFEPTSSRLARLDRIHSHWKEQTTSKTGSSRRRQSGADTAFIEDTQLGFTALQSQLLEDFSTTDEDTEDEEMDGVSQQRTALASQDNEPAAEAHSKIVLLPAPSTPPFAASEGTNVDDWPSSSLDRNTNVADPGDSNSINDENLATCDIEAPDFIDFTGLPIHAFPPAPKVSVERPGTLPTQITKHLEAIKVQNPERFKPCKTRGNVKHDDRGYWFIDCGNWQNQVQLDFWSALNEHVSSGRLGWGVTLHRDARSRTTLGPVRVYCWGELVEHIWLVLWLCSGGKVAGSLAKWYDADGIVALEVP